MQNIIIEKPYEFVPPMRSRLGSRIIRKLRLFEWWLRKAEGVVAFECRHVERFEASRAAGHGIMLAPNHCRTADPIAMGYLAVQCHCDMFAMASWHLFNQDRFSGWAIRLMGAFSINREGVDKKAIEVAIDILESAERPLIVFPEGGVSRNNDRLHALLDGVAFIARAAAKKRAKHTEGGRVVIHPVAIKYRFLGDLEAAVEPVLTQIEQRFSWRPRTGMLLLDRIKRIGKALLSLKEMEYFGEPRLGPISERMQGLIDRLLHPIEQEWLGAPQSGPVVPRVKTVRMKILPDMIYGRVEESERQRRWGQLADLYLAQQVSCYPPDYLEHPTIDRVLETVERLDEDLTDKATRHGNLKVIIDIGEPIEVSTERDRKAPVDPLMAELELRLQGMLDELALESPLYEPKSAS